MSLTRAEDHHESSKPGDVRLLKTGFMLLSLDYFPSCSSIEGPEECSLCQTEPISATWFLYVDAPVLEGFNTKQT